jgi:hypothetical protein
VAMTACPTAKESASVKSALTCKNTLPHHAPEIWHPVLSILDHVPKSGAGGS